jgi:hypothetical protein
LVAVIDHRTEPINIFYPRTKKNTPRLLNPGKSGDRHIIYTTLKRAPKGSIIAICATGECDKEEISPFSKKFLVERGSKLIKDKIPPKESWAFIGVYEEGK